MGVRITPQALEVIRRAIDLSGTSDVGVRLRMAGGQVRPRLATEPAPGDEVIDVAGVRVFIERGIVDAHPEVEVAVSAEHETLLVREAT